MSDQLKLDQEAAENMWPVTDDKYQWPNENCRKSFLAGIAHRDKNPSEEVRELIEAANCLFYLSYRSSREEALAANARLKQALQKFKG